MNVHRVLVQCSRIPNLFLNRVLTSFNKVLNHFKVVSFGFSRAPLQIKRTHTSFLGFILVPIHFNEPPSNLNGMLGNLNRLPN